MPRKSAEEEETQNFSFFSLRYRTETSTHVTLILPEETRKIIPRGILSNQFDEQFPSALFDYRHGNVILPRIISLISFAGASPVCIRDLSHASLKHSYAYIMRVSPRNAIWSNAVGLNCEATRERERRSGERDASTVNARPMQSPIFRADEVRNVFC